VFQFKASNWWFWEG